MTSPDKHLAAARAAVAKARAQGSPWSVRGGSASPAAKDAAARPWRPGDRVAVWWSGEKKDYLGKVAAVDEARRTLVVHYDDGDTDDAVSFSEARRPPAAKPSAIAPI